ncbi:hypothetical protein D3C83_186930 [compost metagenome]
MPTAVSGTAIGSPPASVAVTNAPDSGAAGMLSTSTVRVALRTRLTVLVYACANVNACVAVCVW